MSRAAATRAELGRVHGADAPSQPEPLHWSSTAHSDRAPAGNSAGETVIPAVSLRRGVPASPPRGSDRGTGAGGRGARPFHRSGRPLPGGAGPAGRGRDGECRSYTRLQARTVELAGLSGRMIEQHEEERRRLSRELTTKPPRCFRWSRWSWVCREKRFLPARRHGLIRFSVSSTPGSAASEA